MFIKSTVLTTVLALLASVVTAVPAPSDAEPVAALAARGEEAMPVCPGVNTAALDDAITCLTKIQNSAGGVWVNNNPVNICKTGTALVQGRNVAGTQWIWASYETITSALEDIITECTRSNRVAGHFATYDSPNFDVNLTAA